MPQRDIYHSQVVQALTTDGWTITDDPLHLSYGGRNLYIDLGAQLPLGAEKNGRKIAVEIKTFLGASDIHELELSLGQYRLYYHILAEIQPDRRLYLAVPTFGYEGIFKEPVGQLVIQRDNIKLIVFDESQKRIIQWIP
jgi:hypothetical protein